MEIQKCGGTEALKEASLVKKWPDQYRLDRAVNRAPGATQLPEMQGYCEIMQRQGQAFCVQTVLSFHFHFLLIGANIFQLHPPPCLNSTVMLLIHSVSCGCLGLADGSKVQRKHPQGVLTQEHPQFVSTYHKNENLMYILNPEQSFVNFIILDDPNVNDS